MRPSFVATLTVAAVLASQSSLAQSNRWSVWNRPEGGHTVPICLMKQEGGWIQGNPATPENCQEMLVASLSSRIIWPDGRFYALSKRKSTLFRADPYANYALKFDQNLVLQILNQSGVLEQLDERVAEKNKQCSDEYGRAATIKAVGQVDKDCQGFGGSASRNAYNRALKSQQDAEDAQQQQQAAPNQPRCSAVRFSGIVVGGSGENFEQVRTSPDPQDIIARYPLHCGPSGITQTYVCQGAAYLANQTGHIIAWSNTGFQVATPIDLQMGRKDALVFIKRSDAVCVNNTPPSLDFSENLKIFLTKFSRYR